MDTSKPVAEPQYTIMDIMERTAKSVERLVELQTPGIRGIEGTEVVPELHIQTFDIPPGVSVEVLGNRRRKRLSVSVSPFQRTGGDAQTGFVEIVEKYRQEQQGIFVDVDHPFVLHHSTNALILRTCDYIGNQLSEPLTVSVVEENGA